MITFDVIDHTFETDKNKLKEISDNEELLIIDRAETERLWPLNEYETKIVFDLHEILCDHKADIFYLSADLNIFKRYEKWLLTNPKVEFIPLLSPLTFYPNPKILKNYLFYDDTLKEEIDFFENIIKKPKTKNFVNLTCAPKLLRLLFLDKYYQNKNFDYSFYPWHHGKKLDFEVKTIIKPLEWLNGEKIKSIDSKSNIEWINPNIPTFIHDSAPFKELTEFSKNWKSGSLNKTFFNDLMPIESFESNCDVVFESYINYDSVLITEKTLKQIIFKRPFILFGSKNQNMCLKKMGFELYDEIFDYDFDTHDTVEKRFNSFCKQIDRYVNLQPTIFSEKLLCIQNKIEHNFQFLLKEYEKTQPFFDLLSASYDQNITLKHKFDNAKPLFEHYESVFR